MVARVVVVTNPIRAANRYTGRPRKLFRGVTRTLIRKTLAKLQAILAGDLRQANRGLVVGFTPARVAGSPDSLAYTAFQDTVQRLTGCMAMMEGEDV